MNLAGSLKSIFGGVGSIFQPMSYPEPYDTIHYKYEESMRRNNFGSPFTWFSETKIQDTYKVFHVTKNIPNGDGRYTQKKVYKCFYLTKSYIDEGSEYVVGNPILEAPDEESSVMVSSKVEHVPQSSLAYQYFKYEDFKKAWDVEFNPELEKENVDKKV